MPTWGARYVRLKDHAEGLARLQQAAAGAEVYAEASSAFAAIVVPSPALEPEDLSALSRSFGEAISIQVQSVADLVVFDRFVGASRARGLTYAGEAGWIRVVGAPEPWEASCFFGDARLARLLEELEDDCSDEAMLARETAEVRRLFSGGVLEEGATRPAPDWRSISQTIERHYGLPATQAAQSTRLPRSS